VSWKGYEQFDLAAYNARLAQGMTNRASTPCTAEEIAALTVAVPAMAGGVAHRMSLQQFELVQEHPLLDLCRHHRLPVPEVEVHFHAHRKWRFDYAWREQRVALEVDGGQWIEGGGRHNRREGFVEDQRKLNAAVLLGWRVLRYTPDRLQEAVRDLRLLLTEEKA